MTDKYLQNHPEAFPNFQKQKAAFMFEGMFDALFQFALSNGTPADKAAAEKVLTRWKEIVYEGGEKGKKK